LLVRLEAIGEASATMDEYTDLRKESQRLYQLGQELSRAHLASRDQVMARVGVVTTELRVLMLISLGLLFWFALALAYAVYRDMILPLRVKLVESETLRERQEKLASLGVLAAGIAHEIRNPLTAIKAALFVQQKRFQPDTQEAADVKVIDREILRLERIVNDFLLFARPGDSKLVSMTADIPLREVQALLAPQLAGNNIQLVLDGTPPLQIAAAADQIKQVLINLVRNAAEASAQNGVVKLRARADRRRLAGKETNVVILEVEDNGKGIPAEAQKRLFDPFFTTKDSGTGLGLSIAASLVQSHGGALEYQTAPGLGTTFGVVLPAPAS
jgi:signal transduction histidine kinase